MTIAACYVSPEGVVLGADSTSTYGNPSSYHYYNFGQKVFEVGQDATLGLVTWGLGGLEVSSYRTLIARFSDNLAVEPAANVGEVAQRWAEFVWPEYLASPMGTFVTRCRELAGKPPFDPACAPPNPAARTEEEESEFLMLSNGLVAGFCIGGYIRGNREPAAYEIIVDPLGGVPAPVALAFGNPGFWGVPNLIRRLIYGCADELRESILASGMWNGTPNDLNALISEHQLSHPVVPIRDAVDFTHACILSTIKAMKFSNMPQVCGGPIEIAVITTDRPFRWIRHKAWDAAITEGDS